jgi:predicted transcriptional regulator of viral defense system
MKAQDARHRVTSVAETQRGLFTSQQAARLGVPRLSLARMEDAGDLERLAHGVYRVVGTEQGAHTRLLASWLALDPARTAAERIADKQHLVAASHRSAAELYGIGNLPAREDTFTASFRKQVTRPGVRVSQRTLTRDDVRVHEGMLVTTPERTIADLARTEGDRSHVADALADALADHLTNRNMVVDAMPGRTQREKRQAVDAMLAYAGLDAEALAERFIGSEAGKVALESIAESISSAMPPAIGQIAQSLACALETYASQLPPVEVSKEMREALNNLARAAAPLAMATSIKTLPWEELSELASRAQALESDRDD